MSSTDILPESTETTEPKETPKEIPPEPLARFPAQGQVAPKIARQLSDLDAMNPPEDIRKTVYLDKDGNLVPEWVQVARIFNRPVKKVAIVGFADTKVDAPYNDPTFEIWGLNDLHGSIPRYDRWFDIHTRANIEEDCTLIRNKGQVPPENVGLSGLKKLNVPVYMQDHYADIPNSVKFPLKEITEAFPFGKYMTNSISYMTALAILEGYQEIHIYGVDMAVGSEYVDQRPSCEYWIGLAAGRGVKIYIPPASDLCKCRFLYAFEQPKQDLWKEKIDNMIKNMGDRRNALAQQEQQAHDTRMQYEGAIGAIRESVKVWANLGDNL